MFRFLRFRHKTLQVAKGEEQFNFRNYSWRQFRKNKPAFFSLILLFVWVLIALLAPIIANEKPLYCIYKGNKFYPAFSSKVSYEIINGNEKETISLNNFDWKHTEYDKVVWAACAYSPGKSDVMNIALAPGDQQVFKKENGELIQIPSKFKHRLGTTKDGGDVMAGMIHGVKFSLLIGVLSMLLASVVGIFSGALAGYFGDTGMKTKRGVFWFVCLGVFFAWYYAFSVRSFELKDAMEQGGSGMLFQLLISIVTAIVVLFVFIFLGRLISRFSFFSKQVSVPVDSIVSRIIEIINSLPLFLVILAVAAISRPSFITMVLIIGFSSWTSIARFTRAEFLKVGRLDYIQAARSLGLKNRTIIFRHALPNAIGPALIAIAFGIAGAILTESGLSFIGVGVPPETVTWGKILSEAKQSASSWWLVVFPGIAIFLTVTMYNLIGEGLRDALDPKLKK